MASVRTIAHGQGRRDSKTDIGRSPASSVPVSAKSEKENVVGATKILDIGASQPVTVSNRALLPLATLQKAAPDAQRNIATFLTLREAIWLMLVSKQIHSAIRRDPSLNLDEIIGSFSHLYSGIQTTQAELSAVKLIRLSPEESVLKVTLAGVQFKVSKRFATKARQEKEKQEKAEAIEKSETRKFKLMAELNELEAQVEPLWFHFVSGHIKRTGTAEYSEATVHEQAAKPQEKIQCRLHTAINNGDPERVRTELHEFLSVPTQLMPNAKKLAKLCEVPQQDTLKVIGQRWCGTLELTERRQYDAIMAYVGEVAGSKYLSPGEKAELCLTRESIAPDHDLVRHAMRCSNPAFAASILLGIHECSAERDHKRYLLAAIAAAWDGGLANCIDNICDSLGRFEHRSPEWVTGRIARLKSMQLPLSMDFLA